MLPWFNGSAVERQTSTVSVAQCAYILALSAEGLKCGAMMVMMHRVLISEHPLRGNKPSTLKKLIRDRGERIKV